jgi:serine/threonine-protein kinase HipA
MFDVLLYDRPIGTVVPRGRGIRFQYLPKALDLPHALSLALPKSPAPYPDSKAGPFFRNLLPEQSYRKLVIRATGTTGDDSALLGAIGGECPGAVAIWPDGTRPHSMPEYTPLSSRELAELFGRGPANDLAAAVARGRLSLPGVQEKIALLRKDDGSWCLPLHGAVTSHILKQATQGFPDLLENELLCMALAKAAGLDVASAALATPEVRIYCTERFDRPGSSSGARQKLHQEDFCQILGIEPGNKYENDGGPGLKACAEVLRRHSALPADDLRRLTQWTAFNYLIGNEDAHAKNLALLYRTDGLHLTPFYDLVSTEVYPSLERRLAMKIGRATDIRNVQRSDWRRFAAVVRLPWPQVRAWLLEVSDTVVRSFPGTVEHCRQAFGSAEVYSRIAMIVDRHAHTLQRELAKGP